MTHADCIPTGPDVPLMVKVPRLARWLGIPRSNVLWMAEQGILPPVRKLGPKFFAFVVEEVRVYLQRFDAVIKEQEQRANRNLRRRRTRAPQAVQ